METIARKRRVMARHNDGSVFVDGIRHEIERTEFSDGRTNVQVVRYDQVATETGSMVSVRRVVAHGEQGVQRWMDDHAPRPVPAKPVQVLSLIGRERGHHSNEYIRTRARLYGSPVRRVREGEVVRSVPVVLPHMTGRHRAN